MGYPILVHKYPFRIWLRKVYKIIIYDKFLTLPLEPKRTVTEPKGIEPKAPIF